MRKKDEWNILPSQYYTWRPLDTESFKRLANSTSYQKKVMDFFVHGKMEILYSINTPNIQKTGLTLQNDIVVLYAAVETANLTEKTWKEIISAIQRGMPHNIIIIFGDKSQAEKYRVALAEWHPGKVKKISAVDEAYFSEWMKKEELKEFFREYYEGLENPTSYFLNELWISMVYKIKLSHEQRLEQKRIHGADYEKEDPSDSEMMELLLELVDQDVLEELLYYDRDVTKIFQTTDDADEDFITSLEDMLWENAAPSEDIKQIIDWMRESEFQKDDFITLYKAWLDGTLDWINYED